MVFAHTHHELLEKAKSSNLEKGGSIMFELRKEAREKEAKNPKAPKIGYYMNSLKNIDDEAHDYLAMIRTTPILMPQSEVGSKCPLCDTVYHSYFHEDDC